jgi:3-phosphoshikimate 1-carboxyvinyltransferase
VEVTVRPGKIGGEVRIPGSKSHTIRALAIATLAEGESRIAEPLESEDTRACIQACRAMGADITAREDVWIVRGTGGSVKTPENVIDVANSGTTLRVLMGLAALCDGWTIFTGDEQIRRRPVGALLDALIGLGAEGFTTRANGCPPLALRGPIRGGRIQIACPTSQYLTSLLISCPLAKGDTQITVIELNEQPYVEITLDWLDRQAIRYSNSNFKEFRLPGGQRYRSFEREIPADFSSATFFLCAAAITGCSLTLRGLDRNDSQGDREVVNILEEMGCRIESRGQSITITGGSLQGRTLDLNSIPDALPALAATACYASGTTRLVNVPQARLKETDRITVMREELTKMGAQVEELAEGLVVRESRLQGSRVSGHSDHRVVMALAVAALGAKGPTTIETAEAAAATFPEFFDLLEKIKSS